MVTDSRSDSKIPREVSYARRIRHTLASLTRRAGFMLARHAPVPAEAATTRPAPRWTKHPSLPALAGAFATSEPRVGRRPQAPRERLRTIATSARLPHTIQLCIHCGADPAGFWVSRAGGKTVRRPWCLSCCEELDRDRYGIIPFDR